MLSLKHDTKAGIEKGQLTRQQRQGLRPWGIKEDLKYLNFQNC